MTAFAEKAYDACAAKAKLLGRRLGRSEWLETVQAVFDAHSVHGRRPGPAHRRPASATAIDEEWIGELEANPVYTGIDIKRELGKAQAWAGVNGVGVTRRRFINWLNRAVESRPILVNGQGRTSFGPKPVQEQEPHGWREWVRENCVNADWADSPWLALDASARQHIRSQLPK